MLYIKPKVNIYSYLFKIIELETKDMNHNFEIQSEK